MRGKTRVGSGLSVWGLALTAWLGIAALPALQFPGWGALPVVMGIAGAVLLVWGLVVYGVDAKRARKSKASDGRVMRAEIEASIARSRADISTQEYWRTVAASYGDKKRVQQIDANLAALRGELTAGERDLEALD